MRTPKLYEHDGVTPMGMDLSMMRTPDTIPKGLPKILRGYPGYFRGVPRDAMNAAGVLDHDTELPNHPDWPPAGLTQARAEELLLLFEEPADDDPETSVMETRPTYRELRQMQRYVDADRRPRALCNRCMVCEVCGRDFYRMYGERSRSIVECHHTVPLATTRHRGRTLRNDLALVCANCHALIHSGRRVLSLQAAKERYRKARRR